MIIYLSKEIPSIVVESLPDSPHSPNLSVNNGYDTSGYAARPGSPTPDRRFSTPDVSLALDNTPKLQRSNRRTSDISMLSTDLGYTSQWVCIPVIGFTIADVIIDEHQWSKIHKMFLHLCRTRCGEVCLNLSLICLADGLWHCRSHVGSSGRGSTDVVYSWNSLLRLLVDSLILLRTLVGQVTRMYL